jgi:hypothetical protein
MIVQNKRPRTGLVFAQANPLHVADRSKCFINRLPIELLSSIFIEVFYNSDRSSGLVEHVCSSWRTIAINMPHLWTNIRVTMNMDLDKLRAKLSRSGSLSLDILVFLSEDDALGDTPEDDEHHFQRSLLIISQAFQILSQNIDRWGTLELNSFTYQYTAIFLKFLAECSSPPRLQSLGIYSHGELEEEDRVELAALVPFLGHACLPSLKRVELMCVGVDPSSWKFLQSLTVFSYNASDEEENFIAEVPYFEILKRSPQLEDLTLAGIYVIREDTSTNHFDSPQITLNNLTSLCLAEIDIQSALAFSGPLVLPNLRFLVLDLLQFEAIDPLLQHFASSSSGGHQSALARVEELEILGAHCNNTKAVMAFVYELRELKEFTLSCESSDDIWLQMLACSNIHTNSQDGSPPDMRIFPKLRSLNAGYLGPKTAVKIAEQRFRAGCPLEKFRLYNTHPPSLAERQRLSNVVGKYEFTVPRQEWADHIRECYSLEDDSAIWDLTQYSSLQHKREYHSRVEQILF